MQAASILAATQLVLATDCSRLRGLNFLCHIKQAKAYNTVSPGACLSSKGQMTSAPDHGMLEGLHCSGSAHQDTGAAAAAASPWSPPEHAAEDSETAAAVGQSEGACIPALQPMNERNGGFHELQSTSPAAAQLSDGDAGQRQCASHTQAPQLQ